MNLTKIQLISYSPFIFPTSDGFTNEEPEHSVKVRDSLVNQGRLKPPAISEGTLDLDRKIRAPVPKFHPLKTGTKDLLICAHVNGAKGI